MNSGGTGNRKRLVFFAALAMASTRAGAETVPKVAVDCPPMSEEQRASLEARTRAELAMNRLMRGEIYVHCVLPLVVVEHETHGRPIQSGSAALNADVNQWVEEILALIHSITTRTNQIVDQTNGAATPLAQPIPTGIVAPPALQSSAVPIAPAEQVPDASRCHRLSYSTNLGMGLCSEIWVKPANALLGPCASLGLGLSSARIALIGATQWDPTEQPPWPMSALISRQSNHRARKSTMS